MRIAALMENTALSQEFSCSHGLSVYIETKTIKYCLIWDRMEAS